MQIYNFAGSGSNPTTLSRNVPLCGGDNACTTFKGAPFS